MTLDVLCKTNLFIQIDLVLAVDVSVLVGQAPAVDNLEEEVEVLANQLVWAVHKLVILLSVLLALLVARRDLNLRNRIMSQKYICYLIKSLTFIKPILFPLRSVISNCSFISTM